MSSVEEDTINCEYLAYFEPKTNIKKIKSHKRYIMQVSSADATIFKNKTKKNCPWKHKKYLQN